MKILLTTTLCAILALAAVGASLDLPTAKASATRYVCPPCGAPCDTASFDNPGICPACGMALVDASTIVATEPRKKVAILIFNGTEIIDYTGPWEVFGAANYDVYTVAETKEPVTTAMGMKVVPSYTFADAPQPDILLVPGGGVRATEKSEPALAWVRKANDKTQITISVCNGAFILASAGLLDGLSATTTAHNIEPMRAAFPKVHVVNDQRFVDNGKIVTTGGLTAGIDGALHVVSRLEGLGEAQDVALGLEYDWQPDKPFLPAQLADLMLPDVDLRNLARWHVVSSRGGRTEWEYIVRGTTELDGSALLRGIDEALTKQTQWKNVTPAANGTSRWSFTDSQGKPWHGTVSVEGVPGSSGQYTAKLHVAKAS